MTQLDPLRVNSRPFFLKLFRKRHFLSSKAAKLVRLSPEFTGGCFIALMGSLFENEADLVENRAWIQLHVKWCHS